MMNSPADTPSKSHAPLALGAAFEFARQHFVAVAVVSMVLLIPCFWHAHIEAGDLGSHVYNAWLAQLAEKGQAPGIIVVRQWNNVLFDIALDRSARLVGWRAAERIVV